MEFQTLQWYPNFYWQWWSICLPGWGDLDSLHCCFSTGCKLPRRWRRCTRHTMYWYWTITVVQVGTKWLCISSAKSVCGRKLCIDSGKNTSAFKLSIPRLGEQVRGCDSFSTCYYFNQVWSVNILACWRWRKRVRRMIPLDEDLTSALDRVTLYLSD
jgi:hypothetical protein